jgi:hypothetical protein
MKNFEKFEDEIKRYGSYFGINKITGKIGKIGGTKNGRNN